MHEITLSEEGNFEDEFSQWVDDMKRLGLKHIYASNESDIFAKDTKIGRFYVTIEALSPTAKTNSWGYDIGFRPKPKVMNILNIFKRRQLGADIDFDKGILQFSEGLFEFENENTRMNFLKSIKQSLKKLDSVSVDDLKYRDWEKLGDSIDVIWDEDQLGDR